MRLGEGSHLAVITNYVAYPGIRKTGTWVVHADIS